MDERQQDNSDSKEASEIELKVVAKAVPSIWCAHNRLYALDNPTTLIHRLCQSVKLHLVKKSS